MPLVTPTNIPAQPPAPLPTDDRVSFAGKAFSWVGSMEPTRVSFNLLATQTNTNAAYAHERAGAANDSAILAGQKADIATGAVVAVNKTVADILAAKDAIQAGPVASVMGRTGVVTGLVEAAAASLGGAAMSTAPLGQWVSFNSSISAGSDWPTTQAGTWWNVLTMGQAGRKTQIAVQAFETGDQSCLFIRSLRDTSWSVWQRFLGDQSLVERFKYVASPGSVYTANPREGTLQHIDTSASITVNVVEPRQAGDQMTIMFSMVNAASIGWSANVRPPVGGIRSVTAGQILTVTLIAKVGGGWNLYVGGVHPW